MSRAQLGQILVSQRLLNHEELDQLLELQKKQPGKRLASLVYEQGRVNELDLLKALSAQHDVPGLDLDQVVIPFEHLKLIPHRIAKDFLILPILVNDERIDLAMADPSERRVIEEIEYVTVKSVQAYVALHESLERVIELVYRAQATGDLYYVGPSVPEAYLASLGLQSPGVKSGSLPLDIDTETQFTAPRAPASSALADVIKTDPISHGSSGNAPVGGHLSPPTSTAPHVRPDSAVTNVKEPLTGSGNRLSQSFRDPFPPRPSAPFPEPARTLILSVVGDPETLITPQGVRAEMASPDRTIADVVAARPDGVLFFDPPDGAHPSVIELCLLLRSQAGFKDVPIVIASTTLLGWRAQMDVNQALGTCTLAPHGCSPDELAEHIARALHLNPHRARSQDGPEVEAILDGAMTIYHQGDPQAAHETLKEGLRKFPDSPRLHYHLGLLLGQEGRHHAAIGHLQRVVLQDHNNFSAAKNLAVVLQHAGFRHQAVDMWELARQLTTDPVARAEIETHLGTLRQDG